MSFSDLERAILKSLTQLMTYECKIHKILSIRMKAEQFTNYCRVEIRFPSRPMENLAQPDQWRFYWNFNINGRWINSKQFQIVYFGNKYFTRITGLVSDHDIGMLVRYDNPDWWNTKNWNFKILIDKYCWIYFINFSFTISHAESIYVVRMKPADPQWTSRAKSALP